MRQRAIAPICQQYKIAARAVLFATSRYIRECCGSPSAAITRHLVGSFRRSTVFGLYRICVDIQIVLPLGMAWLDLVDLGGSKSAVSENRLSSHRGDLSNCSFHTPLAPQGTPAETPLKAHLAPPPPNPKSLLPPPLKGPLGLWGRGQGVVWRGGVLPCKPSTERRSGRTATFCVLLAMYFLVSCSIPRASALCLPGFFDAGGAACTRCPRGHFCHGRLESPVVCPEHSTTPFWGEEESESNGTSVIPDSAEACECVDAFFRVDNLAILDLALQQHLVGVEQVPASFCIVCPMGAYCQSRGPLRVATGPNASQNGQICPPLSSTRTVACTSKEDCECQPGAFRHPSVNTTSPSDLTECVLCQKNHYCPGIRAYQIDCPANTLNAVGMRLLSDCLCLPPYMQIPSFDIDTVFECVMAASFQSHPVDNDADNNMQYHSFKLQTDMLFPDKNPVACFSVRTGKM